MSNQQEVFTDLATSNTFLSTSEKHKIKKQILTFAWTLFDEVAMRSGTAEPSTAVVEQYSSAQSSIADLFCEYVEERKIDIEKFSASDSQGILGNIEPDRIVPVMDGDDIFLMVMYPRYALTFMCFFDLNSKLLTTELWDDRNGKERFFRGIQVSLNQ